MHIKTEKLDNFIVGKILRETPCSQRTIFQCLVDKTDILLVRLADKLLYSG